MIHISIYYSFVLPGMSLKVANGAAGSFALAGVPCPSVSTGLYVPDAMISPTFYHIFGAIASPF